MSISTISRRGFLGLAAGAVAATAVGCSASGGQAPGGGKAAGLQVMSQANEITDEVLAQWKSAHPDIPITLIPYDVTRLNAMLAAGTPPDVVRDLGAVATPYLASKGLALDLTDRVAKSTLLAEADLFPINDAWRWDGTTQGAGPRYGIVKDWSQDMMFWYNKDLWEEGGATVPTAEKPLSYDLLLDNAEKLTVRSGGKTTQYGLFGTQPTVEWISAMLATADAKLFSDDLKTADFTSPEGQQALKWFVDVAKARVGYSLVDVNPDGWDWPPFSSGRSASAQAGYWFGGQVSTEPKVADFARLAPAPLMGNTRVSPTIAATGHWISAKSKAQDEAFTFLEWFSAGDPAKERAKTGWGLPATKSLMTELPKTKPYQVDALKTQDSEIQYFKVISFSPYAQTTALNAAISQIFPKAAKGDLSVGQLADEVTAAVNKLLDEGVKRAGG
jgi:multiple sugar transport system substrate-binding protein